MIETPPREAPARPPPPGAESSVPIVVLAHLHWDWVWQRPQHLLTRLAQAGHPILYIVEPRWADEPGTPRLDLDTRFPNLTVVTPVLSGPQAEAAGGHYALIGQLLNDLGPRLGLTNPVYWLYTPMALPAVADKTDAVVVFDVMDELSAFRFAPPELIELDRQALARADVVFTGGPSMYRLRKDRHPNVHLFPSGVDQAHFARALDPATPVPPALEALPRPRIGYFGVIDERTDLDLLRQVAALRPDYHWVMVGPHIKIDPADLPQGPNIHYLGQQAYSDLPGYCKGFDVCMMPFALNDATRFISPTKTLEYMAAGRPIVSTPIQDVVAPYSHIVRIAGTPEEFVAAVEAALNESAAEHAARAGAAAEVLARQEWDQIAARMRTLILEQHAARPATGAAAMATPQPGALTAGL